MTGVRLLTAALVVASAGAWRLGVGVPVAPTDLPAPALEPQSWDDLNAPYDGLFHFVRIRYETGRRGGFGARGSRGEPPWAHDYPRAERNFLKIVDETTLVRSLLDGSNVVTADDPELFKYPVAYIVEVGFWNPTDREAASLGEYLQKGGFLIVDDFRDSGALRNLEYQLQRVVPNAQLFMLDASHKIFDSFFRVDPVDVIPPYGGGIPIYYGVFENNDPDKRLLAVINYNNDLSEYWEYSDLGYYPIELSNEAYKLGVNYVVYAYMH